MRGYRFTRDSASCEGLVLLHVYSEKITEGKFWKRPSGLNFDNGTYADDAMYAIVRELSSALATRPIKGLKKLFLGTQDNIIGYFFMGHLTKILQAHRHILTQLCVDVAAVTGSTEAGHRWVLLLQFMEPGEAVEILADVSPRYIVWRDGGSRSLAIALQYNQLDYLEDVDDLR